MQFHLALEPTPFAHKIDHKDKLFLAGSCFTEQIGAKLSAHKFRTIENPKGILFNPVSISNSILSYIENKVYTAEDIFLNGEVWGSWDHHTRFSNLDKDKCIRDINTSMQAANGFLQEADWLLLTLGSAFVYERSDGTVVANCHKIPADKFRKRLLTPEEIVSTFDTMIHRLKQFNPGIKIIFTISPVRHLRDGFVENNRSKACLIQAVHHLVDKFEGLFYFPAYELVIDDLRDYRFFAEDMAHPNYAATNYVWEKFIGACINELTQLIMKEINVINAAVQHKPFFPTSQAHQKFLAVNLQKLLSLKERFPYIDLSKELAFFTDVDR